MKLTKPFLPLSTMALLLLFSALGLSPVAAQAAAEADLDSSQSTLLASQEGEEDPEDYYEEDDGSGDDSDDDSDREED